MSPVPLESTSQTEAAANADNAAGGSGGLDAFRNALTKDDFKKIDVDKNDSLTIDELNIASKDSSFSQQKLDAISGLSKHLESGPKLRLTFGDQEIPVHKVIPSWFQNDAAGNTDKSAGAGKEDLDFGKDDPLAEKPQLTEEQLKQKLDEFSTKATAGLPNDNGKNGAAVFSRMIRHYSDVQNMWSVAKRLPGDPMQTMEDALNKSLESSGHTVKLHRPDEPNTPKMPWMKMVDGYVTIDPPANPKSKLSEKMGSGIIGLIKK